MANSLNFVFIGLSITSSWGNGHATTFRGLIRSLSKRGHNVLFLECDVPWYAQNRDLPSPDFCTAELYENVDDLKRRFADPVRHADAVIVGSYVRDGVEVGKWVQQVARGLVAFYDIDTPVTLAKLSRNDYEYISPEVIPGYALYLSFCGGAALTILETEYHSACARELYCSFDSALYYPAQVPARWELGYLGTYSDDRQPGLNELLVQPALQRQDSKFVVAGSQYPDELVWPENVERVQHLPPDRHPEFYNAQKFTLNITRSDMKALGHSPSVRLFEAAACGVPIISDYWTGLDELLEPGSEILIAESADDVLNILRTLPDEKAKAVGERARQRVLAYHTSDHRAQQLEQYIIEATAPVPRREDAYAAKG